MNDNTGPDRSLRGLWQWAKTPPQVYVVYVLALILVWCISFLAGTMNPKRTGGQSPPPVSTPQR
jgi:hypothetical protein